MDSTQQRSCLYVLQAINQTKVDHILATSHSFYIAPPSHDSGGNLMASISPTSNAVPESSSACDRTFPGTIVMLQKPKSELGTIIGVIFAVAVPCFMLLAIILWKVSRPSRRSKEPLSGTHIDSVAHSTHVHPFCESQSSGQNLAPKSLRSMTSWEQSNGDSSGSSANTSVTPISIRTPYPTPCQPASPLPPQCLEYIPTIYAETQRNAVNINEQGRDPHPNTIPSERQRPTSCLGLPALQEKSRSPPPEYSLGTRPQSS